VTRFVVQYEVEFDEGESINDVVEIEAYTEADAILRFDNDETLQEEILRNWSDPMCVTANAAWPA
jgi:hypothetical protein